MCRNSNNNYNKSEVDSEVGKSTNQIMEGGDFMVNTSGLDHYRKFGYNDFRVLDK